MAVVYAEQWFEVDMCELIHILSYNAVFTSKIVLLLHALCQTHFLCVGLSIISFSKVGRN